MSEFDALLIDKWHENGILIPLIERRASEPVLSKIKQKLSLVISALSVGVAISTAVVPAYSGTAIAVPTMLAEGRIVAPGGEVPPGYWPALISVMGKLPRLASDEDRSIEPFI